MQKELVDKFDKKEVRVERTNKFVYYGLIELVTDNEILIKTRKGRSVIPIKDIIEINEAEVRWQ